METKQTAVEWLENELAFFLKDIIENKNHLLMINLFEQAKEMEKKQLSKSYHKGVRHEWEGAGGNFQDYYEETYGSETSI
jgi:hypothetical protein